MKQNVSPKSIIAAMVLMLLMVVCSTNVMAQNVVINKENPVVDVKGKSGDKQIVVTRADGTVEVWELTNTDNLTDEQIDAQLRGERVFFNPLIETVEGKLRHNTCLNVGGVAAYMIEDQFFMGGASVSLEYELRAFIIGLQGALLFGNQHPDDAVSKQRYSSLNIQVEAGLKIWQNARYTDYLAVMATAGPCYHETDVKAAPVSSHNYGLAGSLGLRLLKSLGSGLSFYGQLSAAAYPLVHRDRGDQTFRIGPQATVGLQISLSKM